MMKSLALRLVVLSLIAASVVLISNARAEEKKSLTVVTVAEMCGGCVTKITKHFEGMKDIAELRCDIPTKTVTFVPQKNVALSPLKLWQQMEGIGKAPKKLQGPSGTVTSKPKK